MVAPRALVFRPLVKGNEDSGNEILLRTTFASLALAHTCVRVQNLRDFPQTKLDREINAAFLLNEHGDPDCFGGIS